MKITNNGVKLQLTIRPTLKICWFAVYRSRKLEVGRSVGFLFFFLIVEVGRSVGFFFFEFLKSNVRCSTQCGGVVKLVYMTFVNFNIFSDRSYFRKKNQMHCMCR